LFLLGAFLQVLAPKLLNEAMVHYDHHVLIAKTTTCKVAALKNAPADLCYTLERNSYSAPALTATNFKLEYTYKRLLHKPHCSTRTNSLVAEWIDGLHLAMKHM
jgi:hypothetical protein